MTSFTAPMKTELSNFCQDYSKLLLPLRRELGKSIDLIRDKQDTEEIKKTVSTLCDSHHRLKTLSEKIDSQQAYVIIFGPLKSGKSTLMNAFSGAYVSEVTALPAYPCLVHVRHEEETSLSASRFNGQTESFDDFRQMQTAVEVYHRQLAEQIREIEEQGETFEPGIHCPGAIRRIDIGLPAEPLKESYTILVDTPGLYSRMKFGYDLMSREFRDSAACAVFVVKTDNLFLEQVFEEFNDLLNLFSRIFLVVNIDGNKCDLEPDGELHPSLESRDPQKIVDAFCSLSMSAPLRNAYEEGRLKIYPIDLLKAACQRLGKEDNGSLGDKTGQYPEETEANNGNTTATELNNTDNSGASQTEALSSESTETSDLLMPQTEDIGSDNFKDFMTDLTDYLNSNDYLIHFMRDSLRQGRQLIREIESGCHEDNLESFLAGLKSMEADYERESEQRQALVRLRELNWKDNLTEVREQLKNAIDTFIQSEQERLETVFNQEVDEWFAGTESLNQLLEERITPVFERLPNSFREFVSERIQEVTDNPIAGARISDSARRDLEKVDFSFNNIRSNALEATSNQGERIVLPETEVTEDAMPIRRRFWDFLLFRGKNRIRTKIFGSESDKQISIKVKQSRLGEKSRNAFCTNIRQQLQDTFSDLTETMLEDMVETYISETNTAVEDILTRRIQELEEQLPRMKRRIKARREIHKTLENLAKQIETHDKELGTLEETFSQQHPDSESETKAEDDSESDSEEYETFELPEAESQISEQNQFQDESSQSLSS